MRIVSTTLAAALLISSAALSSCSKEKVETKQLETAVSQEAAAKLEAWGFNPANAERKDGGYVIEDDMFLSDAQLNSLPESQPLRVGQEEQYRTNNLVQRLPRVLTVRVSTQFPSSYVQAADEAIRRYNAEGLRITFRRITSGTADLPITFASDLGPGVLGRSGGFPSNGNPAPGFQLVPSVIGNRSINAIATIMAHEIGHCIGFRHTDYADRRYSCGQNAPNPFEGAGSIGAIYIPGTATGADPNSWMLACAGSSTDRPFNANDRIALNYLY